MIKKLLLGTIFATTGISGFTLEFKSGPMPSIQVIGVSSEEDLERALAGEQELLGETGKKTLRFFRNGILTPAMIVSGLYVAIGLETLHSKNASLAVLALIISCIAYPTFYATEKLIDVIVPWSVKNTLQTNNFYKRIAYGYEEYINDLPKNIMYLVIYDHDGAYLGHTAVDSSDNTYIITVDKDKELSIQASHVNS